MATTIQHQQASVGTAGQGVPGAVSGDGRQPAASRLTSEQVWHQVAKAPFAVLGYVIPSGEPRYDDRVIRRATIRSPDHGSVVIDGILYLREHIFEPLGMADSDLVRSERVASRSSQKSSRPISGGSRP